MFKSKLNQDKLAQTQPVTTRDRSTTGAYEKNTAILKAQNKQNEDLWFDDDQWKPAEPKTKFSKIQSSSTKLAKTKPL